MNSSRANSCTDITGYGLLGHLLEICLGSDLSAEIYYNDIERVFGPPSYSEGSGDGKVQMEWDIKFDNGVRAAIYDYKQYGIPVNDIDYWSIGGNSPESATEVYLAMGLV